MANHKNIQKIIPYYPGFPGLPPISTPGSRFRHSNVLYPVSGTRERNDLAPLELEFDFEWVYEEGKLIYKSDSSYGSYLKNMFGKNKRALNGSNIKSKTAGNDNASPGFT